MEKSGDSFVRSRSWFKNININNNNAEKKAFLIVIDFSID